MMKIKKLIKIKKLMKFKKSIINGLNDFKVSKKKTLKVKIENKITNENKEIDEIEKNIDDEL